MKRLLKTLPVLALCALVLAPISAFAQVSAGDAAPFMGSWKLHFEGPMGPIDAMLKVSDDGGKVVGELSGGELGSSKSTGSVKDDKGLTLKFTLEIAGMTLPGAIIITPDGAKYKATFDVMDGAFSIPGDASKS